MKNIFYLMAAAVMGSALVTSCVDDDPGPYGNYGDPTVKAALSIPSFYSQSNPSQVYALQIDGAESTDTTYEVPAMTASYYVYEPVRVPCDADTFIMRVNSNARWSASTPSKNGLFIINNVGNGDADASFRCTKNSSKTADRVRYMYFYSNDSTTMHKITIVQEKTVETE